MSSKKRSFMLKNIDSIILNSININYGLIVNTVPTSSIMSKNDVKETKTTKISDIISSIDQESSISFLDENKKNNKCSVTMISFTGKKTLPEKTSIHCFWCKHSFTSCPIGCPIKFVNSSIEKSYVSHITKDKYYMRENITKHKLETISKEINHNIEIYPIENNYYLTDGIFCSFNCTLAFIKDNNNDMFYRESYSLLHGMYEAFIGQKIKKMTHSPHWRLLDRFGGHLSIEEFRRSFNTVEYEFIFNLRDMKTISKVYSEKM
jgi:hypothetical protein